MISSENGLKEEKIKGIQRVVGSTPVSPILESMELHIVESSLVEIRRTQSTPDFFVSRISRGKKDSGRVSSHETNP